jgi:hypothetical protein
MRFLILRRRPTAMKPSTPKTMQTEIPCGSAHTHQRRQTPCASWW